MKKLGWPTILCNNLVVSASTVLSATFKMRCKESQSLRPSVRFSPSATIPSPSGDSYNDLDMILAGKAGFLFRSHGENQERITRSFRRLKRMTSFFRPSAPRFDFVATSFCFREKTYENER